MNHLRHRKSYKFIIIFISAVTVALMILAACFRNTGNPIIDAAMTESCTDLLQKGRNLHINKQTDRALFYYYACAGKYSSGLPDEEKHAIADALNNAGYINIFEKCDYTKSYEDLLKAYEVANESGYEEVKPYIALNIGNVYYDFSDFNTAFGYYIKSYRDAIGIADYSLAQISLLNMAIIAFEHDLASNISELRSFKLSPEVKNPLVSEVLDAVFDATDGNADSAIEHINKAEKHIRLATEPGRMSYSLSKVKAKILAQTGKYEEAIGIIDSIDVPNEDDRLEMLAMLSEYYALSGEKSLSAEYRLRFLEMKDTVQSAQKIKTIQAMRGSSEKREMADRIAELTQKHRFVIIVSVIVSVFLVITLILIVFLYISRRKIKESHRELYLRTLATLDDSPTPVNIDEHTEQDNDTHPKAESSINEDINYSILPEIPDEQMTHLAKRIKEIMETSTEIYSPDFSLTKLAQKLDTTTRAVSRSINTVYGVNYSSYLAAYRVREACRRLSDPKVYGHITIQAISEDLGFKSRSNFIAHFKAQTGLTPSEYIKVAK